MFRLVFLYALFQGLSNRFLSVWVLTGSVGYTWLARAVDLKPISTAQICLFYHLGFPFGLVGTSLETNHTSALPIRNTTCLVDQFLPDTTRAASYGCQRCLGHIARIILRSDASWVAGCTEYQRGR